jgi:hypothetical protein
MKVRNGFVSNSSSSSFVIIGVKRSGEYEEIMENEKFEKGIRTLYVEERDYDYITGVVLSDDDELETTCTTFEQFQEMAQKVATALNVDIKEVKLITGCRPC